jgi:ubiquinone/menaquinone biosynthesis C-methylase UbiE
LGLRSRIHDELVRSRTLAKLRRFSESDDPHVANQRPGLSEDGWRAIEAEVLERLDGSPSDVVLEIGCGVGLIGKALAPRVSRYLGFDMVRELVSKARRQGATPNCHFIQADGGAIPLRDRSIDRVVFYGVIIYLPPAVLRGILAEAARVLKPGGGMLLGDIPDPGCAKAFLNDDALASGLGLELRQRKLRLKKWLTKRLNLPGSGWYSPSEIRRMLADAGFEVEIRRQGASLPYQHYRYDALCTKPAAR